MRYDLIREALVKNVGAHIEKWEITEDFCKTEENAVLPLIPWRYNRRLRAVRTLAVENNVLRKICSYKSQRIGRSCENMEKVLMSELDVCQWITDDRIISAYAIGRDDKTISAVLKTSKGILCNIEIALTLSCDTTPITKHEIVGKEGMISDRSINEQVPVEAVYLFEEDKKHPTVYTDVEPSMPGLKPMEIMVADNILHIINDECDPKEIEKIKEEAQYLAKCVMMAKDTGKVFKVEERK